MNGVVACVRIPARILRYCIPLCLDIDALIKLADYFQVSLDYLCDRQFNNNIGYIPENKKSLITKIIMLNTKQCQRAEDFISGLQEN